MNYKDKQISSFSKSALSTMVLLITLNISGCNHFKHSHTSEMHTNEHNHHSMHDANHSSEHSLNIVLKDNNKWLMDANTRTITNAMKSHVESFSLEEQSQEQLKTLGEQLSSDLNNLIQGCTMTGDAHNALHEFLTNFMPAVNHLKSEGKIASAKRVEYLLNEYQNYFE